MGTLGTVDPIPVVATWLVTDAHIAQQMNDSRPVTIRESTLFEGMPRGSIVIARSENRGDGPCILYILHPERALVVNEQAHQEQAVWILIPKMIGTCHT